MKDIKSVIRLNCNEEINIKYFAKDESIVDTTIDYSELLEYINEIEEEIERLNNIINKAIEFLNEECSFDEEIGYCDDLWCGDVAKLVNILKGEDDE